MQPLAIRGVLETVLILRPVSPLPHSSCRSSIYFAPRSACCCHYAKHPFSSIFSFIVCKFQLFAEPAHRTASRDLKRLRLQKLTTVIDGSELLLRLFIPLECASL
jgi:hypothetical protein